MHNLNYLYQLKMCKSGPKGSRKLRLPDYMTTAQEGGKIVSLTHRPPLPPGNDGFGGLVVSMLASGTRVRGSKPGRSRWIFRASEKSSACLPSKRKCKNLPHVPALRHVKEPSTSVNYECASKIACIVRSFSSRGLSCLCGAWHLWV